MGRVRRASVLASVVLGLGLLASCGSKTGLFGPEGSTAIADASIDADGPLDSAVPCKPGNFTFELAAANLMFVIDRSGSMVFSLAGEMNVPAPQQWWRVLRDALQQTITPFDTQLAMGAKFYPEVTDDDDLQDPQLACRVDPSGGIVPSRGNVRSILDVFDQTQPRGGTATAEAVQRAADILTAQRTTVRTLILATDGAPNCNGALNGRTCVCARATNDCNRNPERGKYSCLDDTRTIDTIRNIAENKRIPVYVIGIGGTERPEFLRVLDAMAVAGGRARTGTPKHYNVQSATELRDALTTIAGSIAQCTYLTPSAPTDPNAIAVSINGRPIARDPTHTGGWDWIDKEAGILAFFGTACEAASTGTPAITGTVSCATP